MRMLSTVNTNRAQWVVPMRLELGVLLNTGSGRWSIDYWLARKLKNVTR
ncbi:MULTISPECIES: hypothetical protein [unclassified Burkholderia]|nr:MULTISPECIES: hypothetical protein [unclassified Burkholderia]